MAPDTLLRTARELLVIAQRLDLATDRMISIRQVEAAAEHWVHQQQRRGRVRDPRGSRQYFIQTAWFLGRLEAPDRKPLPFAELVEHFAAWMREQRGLSEVTIGNRCWHARRFLNWLNGENRLFEQVSLQKLDAFLSLQAVQGAGAESRLSPPPEPCVPSLDMPNCTPGVQRAWRPALMVHVSSNRKASQWAQPGRMSSSSSRAPAEIGHVRSAIMPSSYSCPLRFP